MLNKNTLSILNRYAFGADIDSLESSLIDLKQASKASSININNPIYNKLALIFKEINANSSLFTNETNLLEIGTSKFDKSITTYSNYISTRVYGSFSASLEFFKQKLDFLENTDENNIIALPNIEGIDISVLYINGYISSINIIGKNTKYTDLTSKLKSKFPSYIKEIAEFNIVDFRCKVCINSKNDNKLPRSFNTYCKIMRSLRLGILSDILEIIAYDIFIMDASYNAYNTQWDKLEFISKLGLNTVDHYLVRDVTRDNIEHTLISIHDTLDEQIKNKEFEYATDGIIIKINDDIECIDDNTKLIYYSNICKTDQLFTSTIKGIRFKNIENVVTPVLDIVNTKCNDNCSINSVVVNDICSIDDQELYIGNKVKFYVINNRAILKNEIT